MRRLGFIATFCAVVGMLPLAAQIHGTPPSVTSMGFGGFHGVPPSVTSLGPNGFGCCSTVFGGHVFFGHHPRIRVFFGPPFHHRFFFHHGFFPGVFPVIVPFPYYGGFPYPDYVGDTAAAGNLEGERALANEIRSLREEIQRLREEEELRQERDQLRQQLPQQGLYSRPQPSRGGAQIEETPSTVLVFHDGHRLEVRNYAVVGNTLWVFSEHRARKIQLSELDLDSTAALNRERGIEFNLPARVKSR